MICYSIQMFFRRRRFLSDFFNTMLDIKWRYVHFFFFMAFVGSWFAFAIIWYIIIYYHGDLEEDHLPDKQEASGWTPCVWSIQNFASVFLFSVETQHTIGYGGRMTSEECPEAIFIMSFQGTTVTIKLHPELVNNLSSVFFSFSAF